jgi:aminoglycoside phosphotransferase (APT) family kinase protein
MGASSTAQHAVDVQDQAGGTHLLVLRRYVDRDRLAQDPWYRPEAEAEALRVVAEAAVPAPRLIAEDVAARHCDVPALLVTRLPGRPLGNHPQDLAGFLRDAADVLHLVHAIDPRRAANLQAYAPYEPPSTLPIPTWSSRPGLWARALAVLEGPAPADEGRFIHRDYHPANIVLAHGRVAGVVDWPTACRGPRSIDLARMRLNLVADFDMEAADLFLHLYEERAETSWAHDPYWDLLDAVDSAQDANEPESPGASAAWERFERWVEMALAGRRG